MAKAGPFCLRCDCRSAAGEMADVSRDVKGDSGVGLGGDNEVLVFSNAMKQ